MKGRRVALIGGAGFVGHHLALALKARGAEVEIIDSLAVNNLVSLLAQEPAAPSSNRYLAYIFERLELLGGAGIPIRVQDCRNYFKLTRLLNRFRPQVIVQLAAVAHADRSNKDPYSTFDHSLRTLENALDWSRGMGLEHFVYVSSSMVYGHFQGREVDEDAPLNPLGIYGALKLSGEKIVIAYNQVFDLPYTIVRPSAVYGPRCISRRVVQVFIENALAGRPLLVNGDGRDRLDFTCIEDLVQGLLLVLGEPRALNQVFNLTYGASRSIQELVELLQQGFPDLEVRRRPRQRHMPVRGTLSVAKARELLGYAPAYPLEKGLPLYLDWYGRREERPVS